MAVSRPRRVSGEALRRQQSTKSNGALGAGRDSRLSGHRADCSGRPMRTQRRGDLRLGAEHPAVAVARPIEKLLFDALAGRAAERVRLERANLDQFCVDLVCLRLQFGRGTAKDAIRTVGNTRQVASAVILKTLDALEGDRRVRQSKAASVRKKGAAHPLVKLVKKEVSAALKEGRKPGRSRDTFTWDPSLRVAEGGLAHQKARRVVSFVYGFLSEKASKGNHLNDRQASSLILDFLDMYIEHGYSNCRRAFESLKSSRARDLCLEILNSLDDEHGLDEGLNIADIRSQGIEHEASRSMLHIIRGAFKEAQTAVAASSAR